MIPIKLTLHNFMSYKNPTPLDFSSFDLACLCGNNGSGKTSILEAITWTLWGKARASSPDALIHHQEQGMWIDFEFEKDKKRYRVIRKRSRKGRGTSELEFLAFSQGWQSLTGATLKETEQKIEEVLKLPYEIFINSAYLRQGHADEFTTKAPSQRKEILGQILNLDFYELLSQKAKEKIKEGEAEEQAITTSLEEIKENLKEKKIFEKEFKETQKILKERGEDLKKEEKKLSNLNKQKTQFDLKAEKLESQGEQLIRLEEEGKELKEELNDLKRELSKIENLLKKAPEIEKGYQKLENLKKDNEKLNQKLSQFSQNQERLGVLKNKEEEINLKIKKIESIATCPTCLRPLSKPEAQKIIKGLKTKFEKEVASPLKNLKKKIEEIGYSQDKHQKIKEETTALSHFERENRELEQAKKSQQEREKFIKKTEQNLLKKRTEYSKILKEKKNLEIEVKKLEPTKEAYLEQEDKVSRTREELGEIQERFGAFKQRLDDLKKQEELYQVKRQKLEVVKKEIGVNKQLSEIFSKKGLQAMIIETVLPEIEEEANKILEKITDAKMRISFLTKKGKKTGEGEIETLEIKITDPFGERDYEMYSGGEAFRIDLAIRVALSKVLSQKAGTKLQFLAIDEGFGSLDQAGKDEVVETISSLKGEFDKILVVTHLEELKNLFPTRIEVEKDDQGSHLEVTSV